MLLTTQQPKVIDKRILPRRSQVLAYGPAQEQDEHHRRGNPERPVQIRVAFEHVEEVGSREEGRPAPLQHGRCVYVEKLLVEADRPQETLP